MTSSITNENIQLHMFLSVSINIIIEKLINQTSIVLRINYEKQIKKIRVSSGHFQELY